MAKVQTKIGWGCLYLFKETAGYAPACVISAHGYYRHGDPDYSPQGNITLHFYCQHGNTVQDIAQVRNAPLGNPVGPPVTAGVQVTDYVLTKYQAHGAEIREIEQNAARRGIDDPHAAAIGLYGLVGEAYEHLMAMNLPGYDIVTIRNRHWMPIEPTPQGATASEMPSGQMRLSEVIPKIQNHHQYNTYHCLFCREQKA